MSQILRYDEIRMGDVGTFSDSTVWIAKGEFIPDYTDQETGNVWGTIAVFIPIESTPDYEDFTLAQGSVKDNYIEGIKTTKTTVIHRMSNRIERDSIAADHG